MKQIQSDDFIYVDVMLENRQKTRQMGRVSAYDLSDLYLLVLLYRRVYWQQDEEKASCLLQLALEIEYLYNALYPDLPRIQDNRNTRNAGRPKRYGKEFEDKVMKLSREGLGPTKIAAQVGCAKSTVSVLIRERRFEEKKKQRSSSPD